MPMTPLGGHYYVMASINDVVRPMRVDTGAAVTMLKTSVVDQLKLKRDPSLAHASRVLGWGQTEAEAQLNAIPSILAFGDLVYRDRGTVVAKMDDGNGPEKDSIGVLGDDVLSQFDVELDFPSKKLTLYRAADCYGTFAPWTGDYAATPFLHDNSKITVDIVLNEERTRAMVDTGAGFSFVSRNASALWDASDSEFSSTSGRANTPFNDRTSFAVKTVIFDKRRIGDEIFPRGEMAVVDVDVPMASAMIGLDYWRTRRVWISYPNKWMFISDKPATIALAYPVATMAKAAAANGKSAVAADDPPSPLDDPSGAQSVVHRSVMKNKPAWLLPIYSVDETCEPSAPNVSFAKPPTHGVASLDVRDRHTEYPTGSPFEKCNARTIPMIVVKYAPADGFVGEDAITVDEVFPDGTHRVERVNVTVD
jgi:Aspartyl protease